MFHYWLKAMIKIVKDKSYVWITNTLLLPALTFLLLALAACTDEQPEQIETEPVVVDYVETGDLAAIKKHGQLRVLRPRMILQQTGLPRRGMPMQWQSELLSAYAQSEGLQLRWITLDDYSELIPALLAGKGDLIMANMTVTQSRSNQIEFSLPLELVREKLVTRRADQIKTLADLKDKTIAVKASASYWETAKEVVKRFPQIALAEVPESTSYFDLLGEVAAGKYDATILDSNVLGPTLIDESKLQVSLTLAKGRAIAWGLRKDAETFRQSINRWLQTMRVEQDQQTFTDDFDQIQQRKVLRVLTRNNAATYYLWRGELMGFEYDLLKKFASQHKLRLEMIVVPDREQLWEWLEQGKGDLIAASITRRDLPGFAFTEPYNVVNEVIVGRKSESKVKKIENLAGREVVVRQGSSYWHRIKELQQKGIAVKLKSAPASMETEEIIDRVAKGEYDLTLADSNILDIELAWRDDIASGLVIKSGLQHGWVVRQTNPLLLQTLNQYVKNMYRGMFYNVTRNKYFKHVQKIQQQVAGRVDGAKGNKLSPYDGLVKELSEKWDFDWRLIVSQMYQESRFNPHAKSNVGALGLMQVMPRTASEFGIRKLALPKSGIEAGVRYMHWLRKQFDNGLPLKERVWFVLASYNAGFGHVQDARRLAMKKGWDPNQWFDNVERSMLLLSQRRYASKARFGYVRGGEPVNYVRQIRDRYEAYVKLTAM